EPGRRSARIPAGQTLREADTPAAQGNCASRRRTGRVRILLSLESIRTRPQLEEDAPRVGFRRVASALDDVDGEAAERCLLVLRGHIRAGLAHRLDHLVEADSMLAVAPQRHPRGVDGLARRERIAFDA